jgi:hypothetical protein
MSIPEYFIGTGDLYVAKQDTNGLPLTFRNVGEVPVVEWDATSEFVDNFKTSKGAPNMQDLHQVIKQTGNLTVTMIEKTGKNLELFLGSDNAAPAGGNYTGNDAFPSGIALNESYLLPKRHVGITSLVIKDSAGSPATLVSGTDYSYNADTGLVTFLNLGTYVQPFKAFSYTYVVSSQYKLLSKVPPLLAVMFDGNNLLVANERIRVIFDSIAFEPLPKLSLKQGSATGTANARDDFQIKGAALLGQGKTLADGFGEYREY